LAGGGLAGVFGVIAGTQAMNLPFASRQGLAWPDQAAPSAVTRAKARTSELLIFDLQGRPDQPAS